MFSGFYVLDLLLKVYGIGIVQFFIGAESLFNVGSKIAEVLVSPEKTNQTHKIKSQQFFFFFFWLLQLGLLSLVSLVVFLPIASLRRYQLPVVINAIWSTPSSKNWERVQEVLKTLGGLTKVILSLRMRIFGHR